VASLGEPGDASAVPVVRWAYSLFMWLAQPLLRAKLRRRAQAEPGYGEAIDERFGHYTQPAVVDVDVNSNVNALVWLHAVSLGEARAAAALVTQLRAEFPGMRLLLTHGTATGRAQGTALLQPGDVQVWQPWDTPGAVGRFLAHFRPCVGLLVETEVWPNMVAACARAGVPLCLVNARMSEKSLRQAQRLAWLSRPAFSGLRAVWAQTEEDAVRLRVLGAPVQGVMGNFKFDATPEAKPGAMRCPNRC
jgi:3-deoxy-D-manno-octulosonic-acid transferase